MSREPKTFAEEWMDGGPALAPQERRLAQQLIALGQTDHPSPAFTAHLGDELASAARSPREDRRQAHPAQYSRMQSVWQWSLSVAGIALLVAVLVFTIHLLPQGARTPGAGPAASPEAAVQETPVEPQTAPALAADACPIPPADFLPSNLLTYGLDSISGLAGGGRVESGPFAISLWLSCIPLGEIEYHNPFAPFPGLGVAHIARYNGAEMKGDVVEYGGVEAELSETGSWGPVNPGGSSAGWQEIQFPGGVPDLAGQDLPLRFIYKVRLPDGSIYGAALSFTLRSGPGGYRPVEIEVQALGPEELETVLDGPGSPLPDFPLEEGTRWVYTYTAYDTLPADPTQTITATYRMGQTVVEVKSAPGIRAGRVETEVEPVSVHPQWPQGEIQKDPVWYVVQGNEVYEGSQEPDLAAFDPEQSPEWRLAYRFPLAVGERWCPVKYDFHSSEQPEISDCSSSGEREVARASSYTSGAGRFEDCYQITERFNSGGTTRWFCNGVGLAAAHYDHGGIRFGFEQVLEEFLPSRETPAAAEPVPAPVPPALAPDSCPLGPEALADPSLYPPEQRPDGLAGGGIVESGDFSIELWLACDASFKNSGRLGDHASEIEGLGFYLFTRYHGAGIEGGVEQFAGVEPYVTPAGGGSAPLQEGMGFGEIDGLNFPAGILPDFSQADNRLRYVVKLRTPDGALYGAALAFTLQREPQGYRPVDISLTTLTAEELKTIEYDPAAPAPFPTQDPALVFPELAEAHALLDPWQEPLLASPGWIHLVTRVEMPGGNGVYGTLAEWSMEDWYQIDDSDYVQAYIHTETDRDGRILQHAYGKDGQSVNLTFGNTQAFAPHRFEFLVDLYTDLFLLLKAGRPLNRYETTLDGRPVSVWELSFEEYGSLRRDTFDRETGVHQGFELVNRDPDGGETLVSRYTYQVIERRDPPAEVLAVLGQEPQGYTPRPPDGTPAPDGFDPAGSRLSMRIVPGDDFNAPTFFYGDLYAGDYLLGRVDFGARPGGNCDRSADGSKIAFVDERIAEDSLAEAGLRWLDLAEAEIVHAPAPELTLSSPVTWSPQGDRLAFSACKLDGSDCGLYVLDMASGGYRLVTAQAPSYAPPIWKPDGSQVALQMAEGGQALLRIVDVESGSLVYEGPLREGRDGSLEAGVDSPFREWGLAFPAGLGSFDRCGEIW